MRPPGVRSNARGVFAQGDIPSVVRFVLYAPMLADGGSGGFGGEGANRQIKRGFEAGLPTPRGGLEVEDRALDPDDGGQMWLPFRSGDRRLGFEHGDGAGFVAVASVLVEAPFAR